MPINTPFSGAAYGWRSLSIMMMGVKVATIQSIKFLDKTEITRVYGSGGDVLFYGYGNNEVGTEIEVLYETVSALIKTSQTGRIQDIPYFEVIGVLEKGINGVSIMTAKNCRITELNFEVSQGDTSIPVNLPMISSEIVWK